MKRIVLNAALLIVLLVLVSAELAMRPSTARPNYDFLPQMAHSPRSNAFAESAVFADGSTLRMPPAHTIARGYLPVSAEARNPFSDARSLERGARVFQTYCTPCHGTSAKGDGVVVQRGYPAPPSLLADHARTMQDGEIFQTITNGRNNMPAHANQIARDDRWKVIAWIRNVQRGGAL